MRYFASGSHAPSSILGLADANHPIGIAAPELSVTAEGHLHRMGRESPPVFLDSGAFSEVAMVDGLLTVVRPMSESDWIERLDLYKRLAKSLGPRLCVVAPDRVGSQVETLERLRRYASHIREVSQLDSEILVCLQRGDLDPVEFYRRACEIVACPLTPAFPMNKAPSPPEVVAAFCGAVKPHRVHLLGLGPVDKRTPELLNLIGEASSSTLVSLDSVLVRRLAGRTNGPGGGPRLLTRLQDEKKDELDYHLWRDPPTGAMRGRGGPLLDYTDWISQPSEWTSKKKRQRISEHARLSPEEHAKWMADPDQYAADNWQSQAFEFALNTIWAEVQRKRASSEARRRALTEACNALS